MLMKKILLVIFLINIYITKITSKEDLIENIKHNLKNDKNKSVIDFKDILHLLTDNSTGRTPREVRCIRNSIGQCERGSVQYTKWYADAMKTQSRLSFNEPLNRVILPSSHNSAITYADGYGLYQGELTNLFKMILPNTSKYFMKLTKS
jgi:hypothetical protein